ncbi:hypothetical protein M2155_000618 [Streptomyces sp. SAI-119]|uniref:hypothetical protein n=1 Tax=Streptomyces sp. SAI-119 TaxID=2940541 RepID=UPI0024744112|nr:hypothetical protein [Streptomyces sp. SAI-119]MDH6448210.1 hypothetical protein [Streptomyces sp. SAI-119]
MSRTWQRNQAKQFAKQVELGRPYYVVYDMATNLAPYEDSKTYSEYVFDSRSRLTGLPMTGHMSAVAFCQNYGPVHEAPPRGMRNIADEPRQYAGPLGNGDYSGILDESEIRGLEKHVRSGSDPHTRPGGKAHKRSRFSW